MFVDKWKHATISHHGDVPEAIQRTDVRSGFPKNWLWACLLFLAGFFLTFRMILLHGVAYSLGENGDGTIVIATLEHWSKALQHGLHSWRTTGFFYPARGTLGLTDTYFLYGIPCTGSRILGFGPFTSFNLSVAVFSITGYWGMYTLCRRWLAAALPFSAGAAFIFAFGAMPVWQLLHAQTYTIMLAPCVCLLLLAGWRTSRRRYQLLFGVAAGLLSGLIVLSAAQTAWFLCFTGGLAGLVWLVLERPRPDLRLIQKIWPTAAGLLIGLLLASAPVLAVYLPMAKQSTRDFSEVVLFSPHAADLLHVPPGTPVWSDLLHTIGLSPDAGVPIQELALGYTPGFLIVVLVAAVALIAITRGHGDPRSLDHFAIACILAALLTWALQISYTGAHWRPWWAVFRWIPGARAIRTPFRAQLAAQFLMCLAFAQLLTRHATAAVLSLRTANTNAKRVNRSATTLLFLGFGLAVSVLEQAGPGPIVRRNAELVSWLSVAHHPPFPCDAFYLMPDPASLEPFWQRQSDAMLLSVWLDIPTLNGSSSWTPPGWDLMHPEAPEYGAKVQQWIDMHGLRGKVCGVDPHSGRWFAGSSP
jgi:hypothetical protein